MNSTIMCKVRVDFCTPDEAMDVVRVAALSKIPLGVHFVNAYTLSLADREPHYRQVLEAADLNLPDGRPLTWAARRLVPRAEQVCGPDFMLHALKGGRGLRHYFYGSTPRTIHALSLRLGDEFPHASLVGFESPPFRPLTREELAGFRQRVRISGANVVWVGLGTPRQDDFVEEVKDGLGIPLLAVGAAFDFHAGVKDRAPRWLRDIGLEWAYRLAGEPLRLGRRYLVGNPRFVAGLVRDGVRPVRAEA